MPVNEAMDGIEPPPGVVELREDVPLKSAGAGGAWGGGSGGRCCGGGPRFILACFAVLTTAITLALLTQIYYGDYEVVPHGSVSSSAAACSRAGTDALKAGGSAVDAAVAAALCLTLLAPHRTSLDASGSMLLWEYRKAQASVPILSEWGGTEGGGTEGGGDRGPRLVAALATLHARWGRLPWPRLLEPTIAIARSGFQVSEGLATAETAAGAGDAAAAAGDTRTEPLLADYLQTLQLNSSAQLSQAWAELSSKVQSVSVSSATRVGAWWLHAGSSGARVAPAVAAALADAAPDPDAAFLSVVNALEQLAEKGWAPVGVSSGLAVIDQDDTYVALVTGLSVSFGSGPMTREGWMRDDPTTENLDLAPAIMFQDDICGTRYVMGAESSAALAQAVAALATSGVDAGAGAVERARVGGVRAPAGGGDEVVVAVEAGRPPPAALPPAMLVNATRPYAAVNVVQQLADKLTSHADSRGGGLASRF